MSELAGVALGYEPADEEERRAGRLWIAAGGSHVVPVSGAAFKAALLAAVLEMRPRKDARVVVLGADIAGLPSGALTRLRAQVGFLPANGGLISHLNGWENIALPLGYHQQAPRRGLASRVYGLLEQFGAEARSLLARMPEDMSAYERKLAGYVRMRLCEPRLVLAEDPGGGLGASERRRAAGFAAAYLADNPEGTFVQLEDVPDESG